jgi:hypothetical protein
MASPFQRYTGGIEASTGNLVQASGQMAAMTANTLAGLGQNLAQGIKTYNENAEKSEAVNAKIQMLGQEYADKIAMYAKDPEIAQSGILDGMMSTAKMLQEAPTKGYNQRAIIAQEAEGRLQGFGGKLQEWSFLRGREMERVAQQGLDQFAGVTSVTSPAFAASKEFQFDPNKSFVENKEEALRKLNAIRSKNPKMQGTDNDFIQNWLQNTEQTMAKVDSSVVPAAVTNDILSQIQTERKIIKGYEEMPKTGLAVNKNLTFGDLQTLSTAAIESLRTKPTATAQGTGTAPAGVSNYLTPEDINNAKEKVKNLRSDIDALFGRSRVLTPEEQERKNGMEKMLRDLGGKIFASDTVDVKNARETVRTLQSDIQALFGTSGRELTPEEKKRKSAIEGQIKSLNSKLSDKLTPEGIKSARETIKSIQRDINVLPDGSRELTAEEKERKSKMENEISILNKKIANSSSPESVEFALASRKAEELNKAGDQKLNKLTTDAKLQEFGSTMLKEVSPVLRESIVTGKQITVESLLRSVRRQENKRNPTLKTEFLQSYGTGFAEMPMPAAHQIVQKYSPAVDVITNAAKSLKIDLNTPMTADQLKAIDNAILSGIPSTQKKAEELKTQLANQPAKATPTSVKLQQQQAELPKIAPIALGEQVVGSQEVQQRRTVAERQREVADFVTSRMGAIDPTDPERKRRLPVSGFDKFYRSLVPEAEIREYTTPSGVRMMYANGKWEQIKGADPMSIKDIREANLGLFGTQTENGLVPSEYVDGSGVFIGGLYKGSNAQLEKFEDEMIKLIDARRSVKKLSEINDRVGEVFSPEAQGEAEVEVTNLAAMLRTDIIGVGTVSNYEQELIRKVIRNPTDFFNLESKDRAILIALGQRVDRRMKAISSSKGLTIQIKDAKDGNKYQALREQFLREKGILK